MPAKIGLKYAGGLDGRIPIQVEVCLGTWTSECKGWNLAAANRAQMDVLQRLGVRLQVRVCQSFWQEVIILAIIGESDEQGWEEVKKADQWLWKHRCNYGLVGVDG